MANLTANRKIKRIGPEGHQSQVTVRGAAHLYAGGLITQVAATGLAVQGSTAATVAAIGVSLMEVDTTGIADGVRTVRFETDRDFVFDNDAVTPCLDTTRIGSVVYMVDDHTISTDGTARFAAGTFQGMDPEGVRVHVSPETVTLINAGAT